jgi:hypothetical protein
LSPRFDDFSSFIKREELVLVEALVSKLAVEAFDEGVLHRLTRSHEVQTDVI